MTTVNRRRQPGAGVHGTDQRRRLAEPRQPARQGGGLYFYPRDDTPGCTREAQEFTEALAEFARAGAEIVGVSKDTAAKHDKFRAKYGLPFPLVSDAEGDICERYGVWVEKKNYGKTYMGIERATFLIDLDGTVNKVWRKVEVAGHVDKVLQAVRALNDAGG